MLNAIQRPTKKNILILATFFLCSTFLLQIITGIWLFWYKTGFTVLGLQKLYRPDLFDEFAVKPTIFGVVESVLPHFFAMGLIAFVICHFLHFTSIKPKLKWGLGGSLSLFAILYNVLPFLVVFHSVTWAYLSFFVFFIFSVFMALASIISLNITS